MTSNRNYDCICCRPRRRVYYRADRIADQPYHEADDTPATVSVTVERQHGRDEVTERQRAHGEAWTEVVKIALQEQEHENG